MDFSNSQDKLEAHVDSRAIMAEERSSRKKWLIAGGALFIVLAVALGVGLGVGLSRRNSDDDSSSPTSTSTPTNGNVTYNPADATSTSTWQPSAGSPWQIVLLNPLNTSTIETDSPTATIYDIDLFTNPNDTISYLHSLTPPRKVICYFSAGSYEDFRPDSSQFLKSDYGAELDGWPGEYWLNTSSPNVRQIMLARLDLAVSKGCDGVDPDNIDGFDNANGFTPPLTQASAVEYLTFLAASAHTRGLSIGLKNGGKIVSDTLPMMQWEVNEQCVQYNECGTFAPFIKAGKPVFHIEYPAEAPNLNANVESEACQGADTTGFSTVLKEMDLNEWLYECS